MATKTGQRPSSLVFLKDELACFSFDAAILTVGSAIESYSQERENIGSEQEPHWVQKYKMSDLLDPDFRIDVSESFDTSDEFGAIEGIKYDEVR
jgi:hypothetical protein